MDMKYTILQQLKLIHKTMPVKFQYYIIKSEGGNPMLKMLSKLAEKYAKSTNTACFMWCVMHQPKMPASLIKKDQILILI